VVTTTHPKKLNRHLLVVTLIDNGQLSVLCIPQGFELHYAVNFLDHFALTQHLLP
jgi:NAD(P)-dependent dehydrogenase (short-subunit alcohol dehydrogenase family)